ncbi:MAG TPA: endopeptidase La, partial [Thermoanaerobaculia bacterium]|nr:endopeptidase La [Thermoanaerobaculia bacterium]
MTDANETAKEEAIKIPDVLPVLPLKDLVIFPFIIVPLSVSREKSINAVDQALAENRVIMLTAQKDFQNEDPGEEDLYRTGTVAIIMRMLKLPDGRIRILVQGLSRARIDYFIQTAPFFKAKITRIEEPITKDKGLEVEALIRAVKQNLDRAVSLGKNISPEVMVIAANLDDPARLTDLAASNLDLKLEEAQGILETIDPVERLKKVNEMLTREINLLTMQQEISSAAQGEMNKSQREYFLRQQLKAIQSELGEGEELAEEVENYRKKIEEKSITAEAKDEIEKQIKRLERSHPDSAETSIIRTYLDWMTGLPWGMMSADNHDLARAREILDEDHYDLEKIKERILEYLAVRKLRGQKMKGPILCFVGPPGVGKTSLGRSIARALDRKFVRISLGGVRDEAEIRGHRRTYVGALPGRIVQGINQAQTSNPVFMLDEVDKIGADYRGDPSSALLEVLDPEQNNSFRDHYLGVPYDLSNVMFIVTANVLDTIQPAFLDRMEVIRLSGYTDEEKLMIAKTHIIPKQMEENGIKEVAVVWTDSGVMRVITGYTKEAGLRNLERELGTICRKIAVQVAEGKTATEYRITDANIDKYLGPMKHFAEELLERDQVGVATGLAWTAVGGDILFIEVTAVRGKGKLSLTGQLGDVMKESAQAALTYARAHADEQGIPPDYFETHDIHIHVPAGAIPKDGPSAGITITTAIISVLTGRPIRRNV